MGLGLESGIGVDLGLGSGLTDEGDEGEVARKAAEPHGRAQHKGPPPVRHAEALVRVRVRVRVRVGSLTALALQAPGCAELLDRQGQR